MSKERVTYNEEKDGLLRITDMDLCLYFSQSFIELENIFIFIELEV